MEPLIRIIPIPPGPGGVAIAAIVSSVLLWESMCLAETMCMVLQNRLVLLSGRNYPLFTFLGPFLLLDEGFLPLLPGLYIRTFLKSPSPTLLLRISLSSCRAT